MLIRQPWSEHRRWAVVKLAKLVGELYFHFFAQHSQTTKRPNHAEIEISFHCKCKLVSPIPRELLIGLVVFSQHLFSVSLLHVVILADSLSALSLNGASNLQDIHSISSEWVVLWNWSHIFFRALMIFAWQFRVVSMEAATKVRHSGRWQKHAFPLLSGSYREKRFCDTDTPPVQWFIFTLCCRQCW